MRKSLKRIGVSIAAPLFPISLIVTDANQSSERWPSEQILTFLLAHLSYEHANNSSHAKNTTHRGLIFTFQGYDIKLPLVTAITAS